jgi:hypothetical protein
MKKLFTLFIVVLFTQILPTQYIDAQTTNNASVKLIRALETGNAMHWLLCLMIMWN